MSSERLIKLAAWQRPGKHHMGSEEQLSSHGRPQTQHPGHTVPIPHEGIKQWLLPGICGGKQVAMTLLPVEACLVWPVQCP